MKKGKPITFRPDEGVRRWLEIGKTAGCDMSELINVCLNRPLKDGRKSSIQEHVTWWVEKKRKELAELVLPPA